MVHFNLALLPAEIILLRAESYDKDEYPAEGWPTTITAFRCNLIPWYGLGWYIPSRKLPPATAW